MIKEKEENETKFNSNYENSYVEEPYLIKNKVPSRTDKK